MVRILRAFVWLRWRTLINSLERRGSRDVLERFSLAFEQLAPTIALVLMLPSTVLLAGAATYVGWTLAAGEQGVAFMVLRFLLFAMCALAVAGPIALPGGDRTNAVRFLLLPIPRGVLYLAQAMSTIADPWILLALAVTVGVPLGLRAGGSVAGALAAIVAGLLLVAALIGITLAVTSGVHLLVRDRRRGELLTLAIVIVLPMLGMLPALVGTGRRHRSADQIEAPSRGPNALERRAVAMVPSELYARSVQPPADSGDGVIQPIATLAAVAAGFHLIGYLAFRGLLASPATTGRSRGRSSHAARRWRIPGVSPGTSAVAINQVRLALRTPRGRATLLSPLAVFVMFTAMMLRGRSGMDFGPLQFGSGLGLAAFSSFVCLMAILPLSMNQFAIDRAGLTMTMLAPIETRALLRGKAIGNAIIAAMPGSICLSAAALIFPSRDVALWLAVPLTAISSYIAVAPVAATLSALLPRAVDLNSIGRGSNAHGVAGLVGMLSFLVAALPGGALVFVATNVLGRPLLAPLLIVAWLLFCLALNPLWFRMAAEVFERRRENLGLASQRT